MVRALICRGPNLKVLDVCWGAATDGGCSQVVAGEPVRCAGLRLVIEGDGKEPFIFTVEPDATACPVAALGLLPALKRPAGAEALRKENGHGHD